MSDVNNASIQGAVVEEEVHLTLIELCQACEVPEQQMMHWIVEGVLEPTGEQPENWRFSGPSLQRARVAQRLAKHLEINPPGIALALDLLDEIDALKARLKRIKS